MTLPFTKTLNVYLVHHELIAEGVEDLEFLSRVQGYVKKPCSGVLLSGGELDCSRYSIAFFNPFLIFKSKGKNLWVKFFLEQYFLKGSPLNLLEEIFKALNTDFPLVVPPFSGGACGYFAYELKNEIEILPQNAMDDLNLPDILLFFPQEFLIHDRISKRLYDLKIAVDIPSEDLPDSPERLNSRKLREEEFKTLRVGRLQSNFEHERYINAISRIRRYIIDGDVYQVNLSQRFQFDFEGDPFIFWKGLFSLNPAPFYSFINAGDHYVLSTSMERFLFKRGSYIETRPIKGTRKRGKTEEEDERLKMELLQSKKDDAELSMIVDLLRNDLGKVCEPKTIRVARHKSLEAYHNVYHLVSTVIGSLKSGVTFSDLLRATFPGGSITGCPKIRAMEIIDEFEPNVRNVYTGCIGYLGFHGNLDLNIAIRTAIVHGGKCYFSVGGGIVYDSVEEEEYQETLHKGQTLFNLLESMGAVI